MKKEVNIEEITELLYRVSLLSLCREVDKAIEEEPNIDNFPAVLARTFLKQKGIYHKIWNNNSNEKVSILYQIVEQYTYNKLRSIET